MGSRRVLLVEDNRDDVAMLSEAFAEAEVAADILVAENAVQAFAFMRDLAAEEVPELVLIDLNLPIIKGQVLLKEVREHQAWKRSHAVVLSSSAARRELDECLRLGATECIVKPARYEEYIALARRLGTYLGGGTRPSPV